MDDEPARGYEQTGADPWIDLYMGFIKAWDSGVFDPQPEPGDAAGEAALLARVKDYARDVRGGLPTGSPSMPARIFITADIARRFAAESSRELMVALWTPPPPALHIAGGP